jgi:hypothetical protein
MKRGCRKCGSLNELRLGAIQFMTALPSIHDAQASIHGAANSFRRKNP